MAEPVTGEKQQRTRLVQGPGLLRQAGQHAPL